MIDVILVIGHQPWAKGARNARCDLYEFDFNGPVAAEATRLLQDRGIKAELAYYQTGGGNTARWSRLSKLLVELHCNAFNGRASGCCVLHAAGSAEGARAAQILASSLADACGNAVRHGNGALPRTPADRGGYLLFGVAQTALIAEPFFIDNDAELARVDPMTLAAAYADGIAAILALPPQVQDFQP